MPSKTQFTPKQRKDGRWAVYVPARLNRGKNTQRSFPTKAKAEAFGRELLRREVSMECPEILSTKDMLTISMYTDRLREHGKTLADAAAFYCKHLDTQVTRGELPTIANLTQRVNDHYAALYAAAACSRNYMLMQRRVGAMMLQLFGGARDASTVTPAELTHGMLKLRKTKESYMAWRYRVGAWWAVAVKQEILERNPAQRMEKFRLAQPDWDDGIVRHADLQRIISHYDGQERTEVQESDLRQVLLGAFAGLRWKERTLLKMGDIDLEQNTILVRSTISKTKSDRFITLQPNLRRWILTWEDRHDAKSVVCTSRWPFKRWRALMPGLGVHWPENGLRHSFASHHYMAFQDAARTQAEMGHSEKGDTTFQWYRRVVSPADAKAWFSIEPKAVMFRIDTAATEPVSSKCN